MFSKKKPELSEAEKAIRACIAPDPKTRAWPGTLSNVFLFLGVFLVGGTLAPHLPVVALGLLLVWFAVKLKDFVRK